MNVAVGTYQTFWYVKAPYPGDGMMREFFVPSLINWGKKGRTIRIDSAAYFSPDAVARREKDMTQDHHIPPEFRAGRLRPFGLLVQWTKFADEGEPGVSEAGMGVEAIAKWLLLGIGAAAGFWLTRSFTKTVQTIGDVAPKIFSPGLIIGAMVMVALFVGGKR